jgi:hypothetical protein
MKNYLFTLLIAIITTSCAINNNNPKQSWYYPQAGSRIILHQKITIPANSGSVYIQHGKITGGAHSRFHPYCKIRIRSVKNTRQFIQPDTFNVTHSTRQMELVADRGIKVAALGNTASGLGIGIGVNIGFGSSHAPSDIVETVRMTLHSASQPGVMNLVCGGAEDHPANAEPPTLAEIREALGKIITVRLP